MISTASATIRIGGLLPAAVLSAFETAVASDRARLDWDGEHFSEEAVRADQPLDLFAREVPGGRFDAIESFCVAHKLPFARWCEAFPTEWDAERVVYDGEGAPLHFLATDANQVAFTQLEIKLHGSLEAIRALLIAANKPIPPFRIVRAPSEHPIDSTDDIADLPIAMSVAPMIHPEVRAAVDRLFDLAQSDTGQAGRVANFLLAWHNGMDWGGFDIADLFGLDRAIAADMATVFAFLGQYPSGIYPDAFVGEAQIIAILRRWRKFSDD